MLPLIIALADISKDKILTSQWNNLVSFLFLIVIFTSSSNSLTLNSKCIPCYPLKRAGQPFWLHFNWWMKFYLESLGQLLVMPGSVENVLRSGDGVVCGSSSTRRLWEGHRCFIPGGSKVTQLHISLQKRSPSCSSSHTQPNSIYQQLLLCPHKTITSLNRKGCDTNP